MPFSPLVPDLHGGYEYNVWEHCILSVVAEQKKRESLNATSYRAAKSLYEMLQHLIKANIKGGEWGKMEQVDRNTAQELQSCVSFWLSLLSKKLLNALKEHPVPFYFDWHWAVYVLN